MIYVDIEKNFGKFNLRTKFEFDNEICCESIAVFICGADAFRYTVFDAYILKLNYKNRKLRLSVFIIFEKRLGFEYIVKENE